MMQEPYCGSISRFKRIVFPRLIGKNCFLKCSKTYLRHRCTCFIAESFTLFAKRASASRSTGEFLSRRSHNRDICYQTEGFIPDVQGCIEITLVDCTTLLTCPLTIIERQVFLDPATCVAGFA